MGTVTNNVIQVTPQSQNVSFAGKLISAENNPVIVDRTGSVRWSYVNYSASTHTYYPYGVEYSATGNDTEKYATYTRDGVTGLDYAVNRYYSSMWGRFLSPDPYEATANGANNPSDPESWNRYAYVEDDPVNFNDRQGLFLSSKSSGDSGSVQEGENEDDFSVEYYFLWWLFGGSGANGTGAGGGGGAGGPSLTKVMRSDTANAVKNLDPTQRNNSIYLFTQGTVLVHELLHYATQLGDDAFVKAYGIVPQHESSSSAISRWLQDDCQNKN